MRITVNHKSLELADGATVAEALETFGAKPPFAVALNLRFVHRQDYAGTVLQPDDQVEIVQPVAGG